MNRLSLLTDESLRRRLLSDHDIIIERRVDEDRTVFRNLKTGATTSLSGMDILKCSNSNRLANLIADKVKTISSRGNSYQILWINSETP